MAAAVSVNFRVGGVADVHQAFRSVEQSTLRAERAMKKMYDDDVRAAKKAADTKEKDYAKLLKWEERERQKAAEGHREAPHVGGEGRRQGHGREDQEPTRRGRSSASASKRTARDRVPHRREGSPRRRGSRTTEESGEGALCSRDGSHHRRQPHELCGTAVNVGGQSSHLAAVLALLTRCRSSSRLSARLRSSRTRRALQRQGAPRRRTSCRAQRAVGLATNTDAAEVAKAMNYFMKASDVGGAMQNVELFARLAKATAHAGRDGRGRAPGPEPELGRQGHVALRFERRRLTRVTALSTAADSVEHVLNITAVRRSTAATRRTKRSSSGSRRSRCARRASTLTRPPRSNWFSLPISVQRTPTRSARMV